MHLRSALHPLPLNFIHPSPAETKTMSTALAPSQEPPPSSPKTLYATLTAFLSTHALSTLSLEILPSSHPPSILQDGLNLAIPKKALVQCFLIARQTLLSAPLTPLQLHNHNHITPDNSAVELATKIILLHDPEHLSAANWRKKLLTALTHKSAPTSHEAQPKEKDGARERYQLSIKAEQAFTTSLLTSPLPKHPKSPTLWSHRYWLIKNHLSEILSLPPPTTHDPPKSVSQMSIDDFIHSELTTILAAASRHKANYHAFHYGRRLLSLLSSSPAHPTLPHTSLLSIAELEALAEEVRKWCLAHPRDISGWGFLAWLLRWGVEGKEETEDTHWRNVVDGEVEKVEEFVRRVGWKGASVEWFLREMRHLRGEVGVGKRTGMTEGVG